MKHLPKSTPTEILNDPYGFTLKKCRKLLEKMKQKPYIQNYISVNVNEKVSQALMNI